MNVQIVMGNLILLLICVVKTIIPKHILWDMVAHFAKEKCEVYNVEN
jgi:hypothetical protein